MAQPNATLNDVLDAIVTSLQGISGGGYNNTLAAKNVVRCSREVFMTLAPRPAIAVECGPYLSTQAGAGFHDIDLTVSIYILNESNSGNPEANLINLVRDIEKKLRQDETLGGIAFNVGRTFKFTPATENLDRTGMGFTQLDVSVKFRTDHTTQ